MNEWYLKMRKAEKGRIMGEEVRRVWKGEGWRGTREKWVENGEEGRKGSVRKRRRLCGRR